MTDLNTPTGESLAAALTGMKAEDYGPEYRDHSLEIYKRYLELSDNISDR